MKNEFSFAAFVLLILAMLLNLNCSVANLIGVDVQSASLSLTRMNSMLAMLFAFAAWRNK